MKILFPLGSFYPSQSGGPNNSIYWLSKALYNNGWVSTVITTNLGVEDNEIALNEWISLDGIKVIYTSFSNIYFPLKFFYEFLLNFRSADIVHLNSLFYPPSLVCFLISKLFKKEVVWSPRGELDPLALIYSPRKKKIVIRFLNLLSKKVSFHSTCRNETAYIKNHFGKKTKIIQLPNYLELPIKINHNPTENYLLFIGRIHPKKGLDILIESLNKSSSFIKSDFHLKIAGDHNNEYASYLKKKIKSLKLDERVSFLGLVDGIPKQILYANAYFTIMPSHTENFGNVVVESLAQGTPVISSKGAPWEILETSEAGYWIDNDVESLSETISKIFTLSSEEYLVKRVNSYNVAKQKFDIQNNISKWMTKYESISN